MEEENPDEIIVDLISNYLIPQIESAVPSRKLRSHGRKRVHPSDSPSGQRRRPIRSIHLKKSSPTEEEPCQYINESVDPHSLPVNKRCLLERVKKRRIRHSTEEYFQIREQIDQRHKQLFKECIRPPVPNEFQKSTMARKHYLIAPLFRTWTMPNPKAFGIQRRIVPDDLQGILADLFDRQEDERYQLRVRQQVERDKLVLAHEQDILRVCGNAAHSISYCSILKDEEVYDSSVSARNAVKTTATCDKWIGESNSKYERLSCEITRRHDLEATTLNAMQRMVWRKYLSKETFLQLSDRYVPRIEIPSHFFSHYPIE